MNHLTDQEFTTLSAGQSRETWGDDRSLHFLNRLYEQDASGKREGNELDTKGNKKKQSGKERKEGEDGKCERKNGRKKKRRKRK